MHKVSEHTCKVYELDTKGITNNLKDALDNNQTSLIYAHLMSNDIITHSIYFDPDINTLVLTNKWGLKKLSSFLIKEDCEDISSKLEELNKPTFEQSKKREGIDNSKETINSTKEVSLWERILKVFKS